MAASEADLLTIARALVGQIGADVVSPLLWKHREPYQHDEKGEPKSSGSEAKERPKRSRKKRPCAPRDKKIGPTAMEVLKRTLALGVVLELCRRGGWKTRSHARSGDVVTGRFWQRMSQVPRIHFSTTTFELLHWLTCAPIAAADCPPLNTAPQSVGDELAALLTIDLLRRCGCAHGPAASPFFRRSALCWDKAFWVAS